MEELQPDQIPEFKGIVDFLEATGIPIYLGTNSNLQTIFELYLPLISRAENLNSPIVGITRENAVGNLYFIMHDGAHHFVGIPGLRRDDLLDLDTARDKLIRILLLKEQVATTFSLLDYVRIYWNWRDRHKHGREREEFVHLNQGIFSFGQMSRSEYVDLIGDFVFGRSKSYIQKISRHMDPAQTRAARLAGIPLPVFNLSRAVGATAEARVLQAIYAPLAAIVGYFGEVGYKGFMRYSEGMADFMLQEWYINWSDDFQYGYPLDALEKRAEFYLQEMREGRPLEDKSVTGKFHISHLRHEIALFARRIAEIKELGLRNLSAPDFSKEDFESLDFLYQEALKLYRNLEDASAMTDEVFKHAESTYVELMELATESFPVDKFIPESIRQPFIEYEDYWMDMTGLALPRYGHNSNGISPGGVRSWLLQKRQAQEKLSSRIMVGLNRFVLQKLRGIGTYVESLDKLEEDYQVHQAAQRSLPYTPAVEISSSLYLERLQELSAAISFQIRQTVRPQITEQSQWQPKDRKKIFAVLDKLEGAIRERIKHQRDLYRLSFIEQAVSIKFFHRAEARLNQQIDEAYSLLFDLVRMAQGSLSPKKYEELITILEKLAVSIDKGEYWETLRSWRRFISQVAPVNSQRLQALLQMGTRYLPLRRTTPSIVEAIEDLPHRYFDFHKTGHAVRFAGGVAKSKDFESNSVAVFAMNHESGIFDAQVSLRYLKSLGFEKIIILASKHGIPELRKKNFRDVNIVIAESEKPLDQITEIVGEYADERVAVLVCPEGNLPSPAVHMPLAAKPGAFVLARKLAVHLHDRNVYFLAGKLNGLQHLTFEDSPQLTLDLSIPTLVPKEPLSRSDKWVESSRLNFENWINEERGLYLADLINPRYKTGSKLFRTSSPQAYLPFGKWFGSAPLRRCIQSLSYL